MSRWAPVVQAGLQGDGTLLIEWALDTFFPDAEGPERVRVEYGGGERVLGGDDRSHELSADEVKRFAGSILVVNVGFTWSGPPDETLWSTVSVPLPRAGTFVPAPPDRPVVLLKPRAQVLAHPNRVTVAWRSHSYTDGDILWGTRADPRANRHSIKRSRTSTTASGRRSRWRPRRRTCSRSGCADAFTTNAWVETTAQIVSAPNDHSVRQFLAASRASGTSLRRALGSGGASLRRTMGAELAAAAPRVKAPGLPGLRSGDALVLIVRSARSPQGRSAWRNLLCGGTSVKRVLSSQALRRMTALRTHSRTGRARFALPPMAVFCDPGEPHALPCLGVDAREQRDRRQRGARGGAGVRRPGGARRGPARGGPRDRGAPALPVAGRRCRSTGSRCRRDRTCRATSACARPR